MDAVMNWLWQGGVVAVSASVMLLALRRASAAARYGVCWAASLLVLALPFLPFVPSAQPAADAFLAPQTDAMVSLPDAWWTSASVIGAAWLVWAGIQFARFLVAVSAIRRARARSREFPAHLQLLLPSWCRVRLEGRRARLVVSSSVTSAAVFGWGSPMIAVAPSLVRALRPEDLDRVLVHEWAHVQRRDDVANVAQIAMRIVAGWHPALWWMDRRLHVEREIACDETAVALTGSAKSYAECLMKVSAVPSTPMAMLMAPAVFASGLRARIVKIVSPRPLIAPVGARGLAAAIVLALCVVSVMVGGRTLVEAESLSQPLESAVVPRLAVAPNRPIPEAPPATVTTTVRAVRLAAVRVSSSDQPAEAEQAVATSVPPIPSLTPVTSAPPAPPPLPVSGPTPLQTAEAPKTSEPPRVVDLANTAPPTVVAQEVAHVPESPAPIAEATATSPPSPWGAAAAGGVAIGRGSKGAGVATAGFFSRFARRVADSF
jgi:beta-lactamase regulating signal transducer with metallopeptidase domain